MAVIEKQNDCCFFKPKNHKNMKRSIVIFSLLSCCLVNFARAEFSVSLEQKVDSIIALQHEEGQPGGVVGILHQGEVLLSKGFGLMHVEENRKISDETLFDIASVAKPFTAFSVLLLEQQGKVDLEKEIRHYLPHLPEYEHPISVRNLLQHTSGIPSTDILRLFSGISLDDPWTQQDEIGMIKSYTKLNFEPNSKFVYSNSGYSLLAQIVETVSGTSFPDFLKENIFNPLGMHTAFVNDCQDNDLSHSALGYRVGDEGATRLPAMQNYSYGDGNIHLSGQDMIRWGQNFFSLAVGSPEILERIYHPADTLSTGDPVTYTYGFWVGEYKGIKLVEHSGGLPGFRSQFMVFPEEETLIFLMCNNESIMTRRLALGIAEELFAHKLVETPTTPRVAIDLEPELMKPLQGSYRMSDGMELTFTLENDTLWLLLPGDARFPMFAESENAFFMKAFNAQCTFLVQEDGSVDEIIWHQRGQNMQGQRVQERVPLTPKQLKKYAASYVQPDLKAEYEITFEDNKLLLYLPATFKTYLGFEFATLSHVGGDSFMTDNLGMLEFTRDQNNQLNGFVLRNVGRVQNIEFARK